MEWRPAIEIVLKIYFTAELYVWLAVQQMPDH